MFGGGQRRLVSMALGLRGTRALERPAIIRAFADLVRGRPAVG
ncbi:hypothetical protein [Kitasatospora phosalacinea]|nr:hypothetical protein [Kitasatospora phosalacinea]